MAAAGNHDGSISSEAMKGIHPDHHVMNQRNQSIHPDFFNMALKDHTMRSSGKGDIGEMALENSEKNIRAPGRSVSGHLGASWGQALRSLFLADVGSLYLESPGVLAKVIFRIFDIVWCAAFLLELFVRMLADGGHFLNSRNPEPPGEQSSAKLKDVDETDESSVSSCCCCMHNPDCMKTHEDAKVHVEPH